MNMLKIILYIIFSIVALYSFGQPKTKKISVGGFDFQAFTVDPNINDEFCEVGVMPEFPGGMNKLVAFAKSKLYYPKSAVIDDVQGTVTLEFIVDKKGYVINKKIYKGVRLDLNKVCLNMLKQMPVWKPGRLGDKAIPVRERWSIKFVLKD